MEALGYGVLGRLLEDPVVACLWPQLQLGQGFTEYVEQQSAPDQIDCSQLTIPASEPVNDNGTLYGIN